MIADLTVLAALAAGLPASSGVPTAVRVSFVVTGLVLLGWMVWGIRTYQRTGQATWLWLGVVMAFALVTGYTRYPR
ncbi:MAG: hypothetical protein WCF36_17955 [Candidatus Nanopelagicales bacterium]